MGVEWGAGEREQELADRREGDALTGGLVSQLLLTSARETQAVTDRLLESEREMARSFAQPLAQLYALVEEDSSLPRYTQGWLHRFAAAATAAESYLAQEVY